MAISNSVWIHSEKNKTFWLLLKTEIVTFKEEFTQKVGRYYRF